MSGPGPATAGGLRADWGHGQRPHIPVLGVAGQGYRSVLDRRPALSETLFRRLRETRMEL
jgi:hypothetical protein